jgi:ABC-type Fe3+-siderophore transport system permease subunit
MFANFFYEGFIVVGLVLAGWSILDVLRRPSAPFDVIGRGSRSVWIFTTFASAYAIWMHGFASFIGFLACVLYLFDLRPKLDGVL